MLSYIIKYTPCVYMYNGLVRVKTEVTKRILHNKRIYNSTALRYAAITNNYHLWRAHRPISPHYTSILYYCMSYRVFDLMTLILNEPTISVCDDDELGELIRSSVIHCCPSPIVKRLCELLPQYKTYKSIVKMLEDGYCHLLGIVKINIVYLNKCVTNKLYEEVDYLLPYYGEASLLTLVERLQCDIDERMLDILLYHCGDSQLLYYYQIRLGRQIELPQYDEMEFYLWLLDPQDCEVICSVSRYGITLSLLLTLEYIPPSLDKFPGLVKYIAVNAPQYYTRIIEETDINLTDSIEELKVTSLSDKAMQKLGIYYSDI